MAPHRQAQATRSGASTGEEAAYETVIQHFEQPVFNLVSRLVDDPSDAAAVVQGVFLKVFRNIETFRDGSTPLRTRIYRVAVKEALNRWRWSRRPHPVDQGRRGLVEEALRSVNPKYRTALVLREIEGLSCEEISEILDVSPGTVKSRIVRGWDELRKHLEGCPDPAQLQEPVACAAAELP